jgi:molecular chaperone GrpE
MKKDKQEEEELKITDQSNENDTLVNESEVVEESISEIHKLEADVAEAKDKYIRLYSEFENYRRRTAKEKIDTIMNATEGLMKDLIPVLDDFERAQKSMETSNDVKAIKEGIDLIFNKFQKTLISKGLKTMDSKDQVFDVELHECITQFAAGEEKKGKVVEEIEKGYYLNDKVIRYAKVVVGS